MMIKMIEHQMNRFYDSLFMVDRNKRNNNSNSNNNNNNNSNNAISKQEFIHSLMHNRLRLFQFTTLDLFNHNNDNNDGNTHQSQSSSSASSLSELFHRVERQFHRGSSLPIIPGSNSFHKVLNMMLGIRLSQQYMDHVWSMRLYGSSGSTGSSESQSPRMKLYVRDCNFVLSFELPRTIQSSSIVNAVTTGTTTGAESDMSLLLQDYVIVRPLTSSHQHQQKLVYGKSLVFKDYAPMIFRSLRTRFGISEQEYAMSLGIEQVLGNLLVGRLSTLTEKMTDGKSGNFFFYSPNGQYLCKTISAGELETFLRILPKYYNHMCRYSADTLLTRYYGLHCLNETIFVVMANVFQTSHQMDCIFDLKGSTIGRSAFQSADQCIKANSETLKSKVLKDLDWMALEKKLTLGDMSGKFLHQLTLDTKLLEECDIIDYSLLVGMRKLNASEVQRQQSNAFQQQDNNKAAASLPFHQQFEGGILCGDTVFYLGIIDTLIEYGVRKKMEHNLKSLYYGDGNGISVTDPKNYATRFLAFLHTQVPYDLTSSQYF